MFKTDETVRFGQILSARTLRYGKFNEYIIIIIIEIEMRVLQHRWIKCFLFGIFGRDGCQMRGGDFLARVI